MTSDATCSCTPHPSRRSPLCAKSSEALIIMARDTLTSPTPMDIGAIHKGKGKGKEKKGSGRNNSKGKDKDKEKDPTTNPDAEMACYYCHRKGHRKRDCRVFDRDKKGVNAVEQAPGLMLGAASASSVTPSRVRMIELDDWLLAVSFNEHEEVVGSVERVDSGAAVSVCPFGNAPEIPMSDHSRRATLRTASGAQIEHAGQKMVEFEHGDGGSVNNNFEVADVTRPLVAVGALQRRGTTVVMDGATWKLRDSRSGNETRQQSGLGAFKQCVLDASDERGKRHKDYSSCRFGRCCAHIERPQ